jgi:integrase/recombinase XerD
MAKRKAPPGCFWRGDVLFGRKRVTVGGRSQLIRWSLETSDPAVACQRQKAGIQKLIAGETVGRMATKRRKAPPGCFWRGDKLFGRKRVNGKLVRWSLETSDPAIARQRQKAGVEKLIAVKHGEVVQVYADVLDAWSPWIERQVGAGTVKRYAVSLGQLDEFIGDERPLAEINGKLIAEIIRARMARGAANATIKRDLGALSSVMNFAIDQGWVESNPILPRLKRIKERRDPIVLPIRRDIDLVIERAPGMTADMVRVAMITGARQAELLNAKREHVDHARRQITLYKTKNGKARTIDLDVMGGYRAVLALPAFVGSPWLFWHHDGENYKNFASNFTQTVERTAAWAAANATEFRPFAFHHLRHWHAVEFLKAGGDIYDCCKRLGHSSVKVTEGYLAYLTTDEERAAKGAKSVRVVSAR